MFEIVTIDANDQLLEVTLDGETFFLRLSWNSEAEGWALEIQNYNQETLVTGIGMVPNSPLLHRYRYLGLPPGELLVLMKDRAALVGRKGFLDDTASLIYVTAADLQAANRRV
jgi:hypothetical protein